MAEAAAGHVPLPGPGSVPVPASVEGVPGRKKDAERLHYRASVARTTAFSFIFLLLLPFFASLPVMIGMRAMAGRWDSTIGLAILAVGFTVLMFLVFVEMLFSIRARIDIGQNAVRMTLPAGRGLVPMLQYRRHEIPYADIKAVEVRREVYGGALAPVLLRGARILTKDGKTVQIGYLSEANVDPAFPFGDIADQIADRAGLQVIDRGAVRRNVASKMMGVRALDDGGGTIEEESIAELNRRHARVVTGLIGALVLLVGIGIIGDLSRPADTVSIQPAAKKN
jgi:hypothetical protein